MFLQTEHNADNSKTDPEGKEYRLWTTFCEGDREALNALFRLYYTPLFDYGMKIIAKEEVVKDGIQELFMKLWKKHDSLSIPDSIQAYLLVSIRRILLRKVKQKRNRYERNKKYLDKVFSNSFSKEEMMMRNELEEEKIEALAEAINHLNGRQKETLFLRYYHGLTNQEIAEVIDINQQSVKNNLYRALQSIRGIIDTAPHFVIIFSFLLPLLLN